MKLIGIIIMFFLSIVSLHAQEIKPFYSELKSIAKEQLITPYMIDVTFDKTVHIIFPSKVKYIDLGSNNIIAGKADGTENVIRLKASFEEFEGETNFTVICDDGSFYPFNTQYSSDPKLLNIDMRNINTNVFQASTTVYISDLGNESPKVVKSIMENIYYSNKKILRHLGSSEQKIRLDLLGLFVNNEMFYFHTSMKNSSQVSFEIEYIKFKIVDKKAAKLSPVQEIEIKPVRTFNDIQIVKGKSTLRSIYVLPKFTIPEDKVLIIDLIEKDGGRHQHIQIENSDIVNAMPINRLDIK